MATPKGKTRGLGRGLDVLFANQEPAYDNGEKDVSSSEPQSHEQKGHSVVYIDINDIKPNSSQPRKGFDEEKISELAASIIEHGIIQPLVVRKKGKAYEIVAGERRWRASRVAELKEVPCIIREFTDEENMLIAIIENMQREDLNPIEEAEGLNQMIQTYGFTQEEVSKSVSKSRPYITNALRLLKLPEEIRALVTDGKLTAGHARTLINIKDAKMQTLICNKIVNEGLSVRKAEELAGKENKPKHKPAAKVKDANMASMEGELKELYGTKVSITSKGKKGIIQLEYYSRDELDRLIELLKSATLQ